MGWFSKKPIKIGESGKKYLENIDFDSLEEEPTDEEIEEQSRKTRMTMLKMKKKYSKRGVLDSAEDIAELEALEQEEKKAQEIKHERKEEKKDNAKILSEKHGVEGFIVRSIVEEYERKNRKISWAAIEQKIIEHKQNTQQSNPPQPKPQPDKNDELQRQRKIKIDSIDRNLNRELADIDEDVKGGEITPEAAEIKKDGAKSYWNRKKMSDLDKIDKKFR